MLKLLIVEDDLTIRKGLTECINWENYGIEVSGQAANGRKALEFIEKNSVDIILTDVVMPQMDGIELVKRIREKNLEVKIAFISGHSDLHLIKAAFKLDVVDYIFKPVKREEMDSVLRKITGLCMQEMKRRENLDELKRKLEESMPVLKERFISTLLKKSISDTSYIENRVKFLGLPFESGMKFTVMTFDMGSSSNDTCENHEMREIALLSSFEGIYAQKLGDFNSLFLVEDDNNVVYLVFSKISLEYEKAIDLAMIIQNNHKNYTGCLLAVGIGQEVDLLQKLHESWLQSKRALEQKYFLGQDAVIHISDIPRPGVITMPDLSEQKKKIIDSLRFGRSKETSAAVDEFFKVLKSTCVASMHYVRNLCTELVVMAEKEFLELKVSDVRKQNQGFIWDMFSTCKSFEDTHQWLRKELVNMAEIIESVNTSTTGNLTTLMQKYIRENYSQDITIHTLASEFFITSNYVCILFKKEIGKTFNDYLTEVRMEKAMELLSCTLLKVYEISERVGYHDVDYFGKLFKKYKGLTISQFRGKK